MQHLPKYDYFPSFQFNVEFSQLSRIRIRWKPAIFISALKVILSAALQLMKLFHFNVRNPKPGVYIVSSAPPTPLTPPFPLGVIYSDKDHLVKILFWFSHFCTIYTPVPILLLRTVFLPISVLVVLNLMVPHSCPPLFTSFPSYLNLLHTKAPCSRIFVFYYMQFSIIPFLLLFWKDA